ncbi:MAG TPA: hypothetical protein VMR66_10380 [Gemmatimonadota bacterium]|nr:hypothetical protein [Gemmatimonadota bacterium]
MLTPMRAHTILLAAFLALFACADDPTGLEGTVRFTTSFESGLDGFSADGTDLDDPPIEWSIERSDERAEDGQWSVRLHLENLNDAGKIWIERVFELEPGRAYEVEISYAFATADFGEINTWTIVAGVSAEDPETVGDLTFQGSTAHDMGMDVGFVWLERSHALVATTSAAGELWVFLGVWGTSEFTRTYFLDDLEIVFTPL